MTPMRNGHREPQRLIIDCDPGVDDTVALALAFTNYDALNILLVTLVHGNIEVSDCLKNVVALMDVLHAENDFRIAKEQHGLAFQPPRIAVGANKPIQKSHGQGDFDENDGFEGYHGNDGLNGLHSRRPGMVDPSFLALFDSDKAESAKPQNPPPNFIPSIRPAHVEMLEVLASEPINTVTVVALGPLTNLALAASQNPTVFARAKKVVSMGGALRVAGNQIPVAEFNVFGDPDAAEMIYNLTSPTQKALGSSQLDLELVPLDVTGTKILTAETFQTFTQPLTVQEQPLAIFLKDLLEATFEKVNRISGHRVFCCNDPLVIYSLLYPNMCEYESGLDVRVEAYGKWTRGQTVIDGRGRPRWPPGFVGPIRDTGGWLSGDSYNSLNILTSVGSDGDVFGLRLLEAIFQKSLP